jgi:signal transduction histidine kinase
LKDQAGRQVVADGKEPGSVRTVPPRLATARDLRRNVERLGGLPLRAGTARLVLGALTEEPDERVLERAEPPDWAPVTDLDPGWVLARASRSGRPEPLRIVAERPWWPLTSRDGADALQRLWRHAVAVSLAAKRLAREGNVPEPDRIARAGLLHGLGRWAVAALDPEWLVRWFAVADREARRELERREIGVETDLLGRALAERWGCDPLVADAAWLHAEAEKGLEQASAEPRALAIVQQAFRIAERTPWSLWAAEAREIGALDPRGKLLVAEVQSRCGGPFLEPDATSREERLVRSNAGLRLKVAELASSRATRDRFLQAFIESEPADDPDTWAERAGLAWCREPGVAAARVAWIPGLNDAADRAAEPDPAPNARSPTSEYSLAVAGKTRATIQLWEGAAPAAPRRDEGLPHGSAGASPSQNSSNPVDETALALLPAWQAWAALVAERERLNSNLAVVLRAFRRRSESEEPRLRSAKLDALAEFAAGAGHELNNPLAVIVGRAQLLLARETDPRAIRSLRAILSQAQRTHRILRDLMYVARPPELRPRFCQPDEIVRASLRDARSDADERGVRLSADALEHGRRSWADAEGLRHLADSLLRNAIEATPRGGTVRFSSAGDATSLRWTVQDNGQGITQADGLHLFDPFFCGRQAGRGLGLGLPRAARFVAQAGGEIRWHSTPGQGSTFQVRLPLTEPPRPPASECDPPSPTISGGDGRPAAA